MIKYCMKIDRTRLWKSLGIGALVSLPIFLVYLLGSSLEDTVISVISEIVIAPAMIIGTVVFLLVPVVSDPDRYVLGTYFYALPFISVCFYSVIAYVGFTFAAKKK